ncbi:CSTF2 [Symbiodinium natans]|uniref:CSTF2 protein n=1 Tax=Symbiodinium natans TaxID=878477 RepID=A0A812M386_9DINO|nr:CSTF2 [Symbiodinium natans]
MASVAAHTEIVQTVASMPQAHLQLCLGTMQELAKAAPERARAVLLEHPQLCHALLHGQFLLGLSLDPTMPPDLAETAELRAEAVQRAMSNSKTLAGRHRGAVPLSRGANVSVPYPAPNVVIPARPLVPGALGGAGMMPPPPMVVPSGGSFAKGAPMRPPFDGFQAVKMDTG